MRQRTIPVCKRLIVAIGIVAALITPAVGTSATSPVFTSAAYAAKKMPTFYYFYTDW
jgi:hypothetical protein